MDLLDQILGGFATALSPQTPVVADFRNPSQWLTAISTRTAVLFLGSTIGNLGRDEAVALLRDIRTILAPGDTVLIGADLRKPKDIVERAYNDALGVTASFNMNLLQRINRELGGHFDLRDFAHRAVYDEIEGRIEMHLVSLREQTVPIDAIALEVAFDEGESIHTENSHKYDDETFGAIASAAGFAIAGRWTDARGFFADYLLT